MKTKPEVPAESPAESVQVVNADRWPELARQISNPDLNLLASNQTAEKPAGPVKPQHEAPWPDTVEEMQRFYEELVRVGGTRRIELKLFKAFWSEHKRSQLLPDAHVGHEFKKAQKEKAKWRRTPLTKLREIAYSALEDSGVEPELNALLDAMFAYDQKMIPAKRILLDDKASITEKQRRATSTWLSKRKNKR